MDTDPSPIDLPLRIRGMVVRGYGRGGKQLGFPTANIEPYDFRDLLPYDDDEGVYYGWALVEKKGEVVEPMVMSVGRNPQFNNKNKTVEVHVLKKFDEDFYREHIRVVVVGYIRPMAKFESLDKLIAMINNDIAIAHRELATPSSQELKNDSFLTDKFKPDA